MAEPGRAFGVAVFGLAVVAGGGAARAAPPRAHAHRRPNIVFVLADDARADALPYLVNVRRLLAGRGVTFRNAFVTTSECCPSRASILTGQYSRHTGVTSNAGPAAYPAFRERSTVATWLAGAGYDTALVGKYLNGYAAVAPRGVPPGWRHWNAISSVPFQRYYNYRINVGGRLRTYRRSPRNYSTRVLGSFALRFLARARPPFFLYFAPIAPHLPATPPPSRRLRAFDRWPGRSPSFGERDLSDKPWGGSRRQFNARAVDYQRQVRERQLRALVPVDRIVGRIVRLLRRRGQLDNTVIVFSSDNGFLWGEHRLGGKLWPYEESIRVPLVVRVPWLRRGVIETRTALNIDLAPTFAALAGVRPGLSEDGRSLVPLLRGRRTPWRRDFVVEYRGGSQLRFGGPPPFEALRSSRYLYVEYANGWRELYDLRRDPYELANRAADPRLRTVRADLDRRLHAFFRG